MARVRVNYDGWLALPAAVRKRLGLSTGDELGLELVDGGLFLRPLRSAASAEPTPEPVTSAEEPTPVAPEPSPTAAAVAPAVKRGPGRPRRTPLPVVPPTLRARGGRRKIAAETAQ